SRLQRIAVEGANSVATSLIIFGFSCLSADTSSTHRLRPCVAATISPAVGCWASSWTATVGRLLLIRVHVLPLSIDAHTANSLPRYTPSGVDRSSSETR